MNAPDHKAVSEECPRCEGCGEIFDAYWTCGDPECCGSGRGECPDCNGTGSINGTAIDRAGGGERERGDE